MDAGKLVFQSSQTHVCLTIPHNLREELIAVCIILTCHVTIVVIEEAGRIIEDV